MCAYLLSNQYTTLAAFYVTTKIINYRLPNRNWLTIVKSVAQFNIHIRIHSFLFYGFIKTWTVCTIVRNYEK